MIWVILFVPIFVLFISPMIWLHIEDVQSKKRDKTNKFIEDMKEKKK